MTEADTAPDTRSSPFDSQGWRDVRRADFGPANAVPTMLSPMERKFYLWLAEHWARDRGAIVDLGSFVGGSTACLAQGRARAGRVAGIHAYDRFRASEGVKENLLYPGGIAPFEGEDIYPLAQLLLAPFSPPVLLHKGAIEAEHWTEGPIEILCVDAAKTTLVADRIAEEFFPHLIPGRSVVIQQDYLHWKVPWIPAQMEWLSDCFTPVAVVPNNTAAFLCTRVPGAADLAAARLAGQADHAIQAGLLGASARIAPFGVTDRLERQRLALELNPGARAAKRFRVRP